ncbi:MULTISPECIES: pyridoxal phosphate-dependent decarboxylase family protein [Streptomyces]|uniref:Aspartate aminotransferase family protein n=1 Tax=Streptomyces thermoviolaceus subsp. thermoviolaceus TaxID=66860 RepID=A0ABX0Z1V2_STRTL|nr:MULTISPECIES: aspartate aminotransferase family protein [Streptomyces]NJP17243.1 aspartate aminotransferase family protein [Streptomyces thermoviolaceus subsp. thermoviolaceus]RSS01197.1 aminotransferase class V-fold PLP-dependent enzyme [Streptomyces sp. WAC00469]GHB09356.1 pyridoxal-dependent decarboxylase [Streptomyces thermoviolaceus subsp. thermoviolaceus]
MRSHLLNDLTAERYRRAVTEGVERVAAQLARTEKPFTGVTVDDLAPLIDRIDLDRPLHDTTAALDELQDVYLRDAVYFHHPRYLAHLNCPVVIPAVLGEAVLSAVNSSLDTWDQSAGGTLIERKLIDWTADRVGLGPAADGVFTSGGTQSNLQALLLAREEAKSDHAAKLRVFTSQASHFSVQKSARLLGLPPEAVVALPVDRDQRMQTVALAQELRACREDGLIPMAVVATAGTTDFGSIDPLSEIAELCAEHGTWMHVDAAYGCGLLVSPTRRRLLDGIEHADSVTVDYHKSFFQPVSSSAVLVRDAATLRHATYHADYLNPRRAAAERIPNQVDKSLQTTRRFDALKLWMTLRVMGAEGVGRLFDEVCDLAREGFRLLATDPRFDVVVEPALSTLVFRYIPRTVTDPSRIDHANLYARKALFASGDAIVAGTKVAGRHYLKFTLLNPETTVDDITAVLDLIAGHAEQYLGDSLDRAS